jgi:hypothetical protein
MRRISIGYWIGLALWLTFSIGLMFANKFFSILNSEDVNILLGIIAVAVSIVSIGIATIKKPTFNGSIYCWNVAKKKQVIQNDMVTPSGEYHCITIKIDNNGNEPIKDLIVNFRFPLAIAHSRFPQNNDFYSHYEFKDTMMLTAKNISFLGSNNGDSDIIFEHLLNLEKWHKQRRFYITVSGSNITPTTKCLDYSMINSIIVSTADKPLTL